MPNTSIGPGGIEMPVLHIQNSARRQLQSDLVELKCQYARCLSGSRVTSIGPGGIEIAAGGRGSAAGVELQSDLVELK